MEEEKIETCKEYTLRKMQRKKCNMKNMQDKNCAIEQSATCKLCNWREEQY